MGLMPWEFERLTPAELAEIKEAYNFREIEELNKITVLAWRISDFIWSGYKGKLPPLKDLMLKHGEQGKQIKVKSDAALERLCMIINAQFGGTIKESR